MRTATWSAGSRPATIPSRRGQLSCALRARGFTLFELLVAFAIIASIFALALPAFVGGGATELRASANDLATGLRQTRGRAVAAYEPRTLELDLENSSFQLEGEPRARRLPRGAALALEREGREPQLSGRASVRYFPDGSASGGRVIVANRRLAFAVEVDWLTGGVRVTEAEPPRQLLSRLDD